MSTQYLTTSPAPNPTTSSTLKPSPYRCAQKGVSMLEFALILPFFTFLVFGFIDISRYFAYQVILNKGAEQGINLATKIPNLDVDLKKQDQTSIDYLRYQQARDLVLKTACHFPLSTLFSDSSQRNNGTVISLATLESFNYTDIDRNGAKQNHPSNAALIFPAENSISDSYGNKVIHQTLPKSLKDKKKLIKQYPCLLYTSPSPRDRQKSRMPSSA